jgi:hypothetical protein
MKKQRLALFLLGSFGILPTLAGCGTVGWKYRYDGKEYTMTQSNSEYHQHAMADVRSRFGDPAAQVEVANLKGACELLQRYAAGAPDPGQFTPARELLDREARATCAKAHSVETRGEGKPATRAPPAAQPADEVSLAELLGEYSSNALRADGRFKDKVVQFTGTVGAIGPGDIGGTTLSLGTGKLFEHPVAQCYFDQAQTPKVKTLNRGERVHVRGRVEGLMMGVIVRACEVVD